MDVILHIGAHCCASTSFQQYLRMTVKKPEASGLGVWGPRRTRNGLFHGLQGRSGVATGQGRQRRGIGRVQIRLAQDVARLPDGDRRWQPFASAQIAAMRER